MKENNHTVGRGVLRLNDRALSCTPWVAIERDGNDFRVRFETDGINPENLTLFFGPPVTDGYLYYTPNNPVGENIGFSLEITSLVGDRFTVKNSKPDHEWQTLSFVAEGDLRMTSPGESV